MKYRQLIPATGWFAALRVSGSAEMILYPVACFALCDEDTVTGLIGPDVLEPADNDVNFLCYIGPGESADTYKEMAEHDWRREQAKSANT